MINPKQEDRKYGVGFYGISFYNTTATEANKWTRYSRIRNAGSSGYNGYYFVPYPTIDTAQVGDKVQIKSAISIDLTLMFGAGNEPATPEEFEHLCAINGVDLTKPQVYDEGTERSWIIN